MKFTITVFVFLLISLSALAQRRGESQEMPAKLVLQVRASESSESSYEIPRDGFFRLPWFLTSQKYLRIGHRVEIVYNIRSDMDYDFHCFYKASARSKKLAFEKCETIDGEDLILSYPESEQRYFPLDKGAFIKMNVLHSSSTRSKVFAEYHVLWK